MNVVAIPTWLHALSIAALCLAIVCAAIIILDQFRHPQQMAIMNIVWPVTALFGSAIALHAYFRFGRPAARLAAAKEKAPSSRSDTPFAVMVGKAASHCGSGCTLGDILAEWLAFAFPTVAIWLGWKTVFAEKMFAVWILDFIFAFAFGIVFQYFTIKPMRQLSARDGLAQALKADTLSLVAWQLGMYGFMAIAQFVLFRTLLGTRLEVNSPEFWFMMQIAMICGFATSYPVNWWLVRSGIKEKM